MYSRRLTTLAFLIFVTLTANAQHDSTSEADKKMLENVLHTSSMKLQIDKPDSSFKFYQPINGYINENLKIAVAAIALPISLERLKKDIKSRKKDFYSDEDIILVDSFTTTIYGQLMFFAIYENQPKDITKEKEITITGAAITNIEYVLTATAQYPKLLDKIWRDKLLRTCATIRE